MSTYAITYDLKTPGKDYSSLYEQIKALGDWAHYLDSTWFVNSNLASDTVRDRLVKVMDKNDLLFITKISSDYSGWLPKDAWNWLTRYV